MKRIRVVVLMFAFVFGAISFGRVRRTGIFEPEVFGTSVVHIIVGFLFAVLLFNFIVRRIYWFKTYFISKYNVLTGKKKYNWTVEIPANLVYEKLLEVVTDSDFKIRRRDEKTRSIFATTSWNLWSYGENIYMDVYEERGKTVVKFCSVAIFGFTLGKNKENFDLLVKNFEESLII